MFCIFDIIRVQWVTAVTIMVYTTTPKNPQKDRVCALAGTRKRQVAPGCLLRTHLTFSKSVMMSMGVSKLGQINLIFIDARVKINGEYYGEVLLTQKLLPVIRHICGEFSSLSSSKAMFLLTDSPDNQLSGTRHQCSFYRTFPHPSTHLKPVDYKI